MIIGRFQKHESGFSGSIETLGLQVNPVRFVRREKGADYALQGPDNGELGAAVAQGRRVGRLSVGQARLPVPRRADQRDDEADGRHGRVLSA